MPIMALLLAAASATHSNSPARVQLQDAKPLLLSLRGGVQPAQVEAVAPTTGLPARSRSNSKATSRAASRPRNSRRSGRRKRSAKRVNLNDAVTAVLCLSTLGAASLGNVPLMDAVPRGGKDATWIAFGVTLSSGLYALVRLTNYERASAMNLAIHKLLLGDGGRRGVGSLPALGTFSMMGLLAAFQSLPASAGWCVSILILLRCGPYPAP